jgi:hypothetical protein
MLLRTQCSIGNRISLVIEAQPSIGYASAGPVILPTLFLAATLATATFATLSALFLSATLALAAALPALVLGLIWHHILLLKNCLAT